MFFHKSNAHYSNNALSINTINALDNIYINKNIKLILIFSLEKCKPCNQLSSILDELFIAAENQNQSLPLQVIKFDYTHLHPSDQHNLEVFPTTIVFKPDVLEHIKDEQSLLQIGLSNGIVYKGQIQKLCDDHNLITF